MLDRISTKLGDVLRTVQGKSTITEKNIQDAVNEIKVALLEADVNLRVVRRFVNRTIQDATGEAVLRSVSPGQQFVKVVHDRMVEFLGSEHQDLELKGPDTQTVIMIVGLQGSGKTTTAAKIAAHLLANGRTPLLVAADLARPAAVEQLQILGEQAGVPVYAEERARNPVSVAKSALKQAKRDQRNVVIVDTAGRLQVDSELMAELESVRSAVKPSETLLVADAMTGQNAVDIAKEFDERIGLTGVVLSKFDSDTRGGAALSLKTVTGKPIKFIGVGEKLDDIDPFYPDRIASRILGMGDVVSLVEKAQQQYDESEAQELQQKMASATMSLEDYLDQLRRVRKMGSMQSLLEMMPGLAGQVHEDDLDESAVKYEEAILLSMTPTERLNHRIIGPSRRKRIARGSGTSVYDVNRLLKKFDKTRQMMKKVAKNKKLQNQMMSRLGGMQ